MSTFNKWSLLPIVISLIIGGIGGGLLVHSSDTNNIHYIMYHDRTFSTSVPAWDFSSYGSQTTDSLLYTLTTTPVVNRVSIETIEYPDFHCPSMPTVAEVAKDVTGTMTRDSFALPNQSETDFAGVPAMKLQSSATLPSSDGKNQINVLQSVVIFQHDCVTWKVYAYGDKAHQNEVSSAFERVLTSIRFTSQESGG